MDGRVFFKWCLKCARKLEVLLAFESVASSEEEENYFRTSRQTQERTVEKHFALSGTVISAPSKCVQLVRWQMAKKSIFSVPRFR